MSEDDKELAASMRHASPPKKDQAMLTELTKVTLNDNGTLTLMFVYLEYESGSGTFVSGVPGSVVLSKASTSLLQTALESFEKHKHEEGYREPNVPADWDKPVEVRDDKYEDWSPAILYGKNNETEEGHPWLTSLGRYRYARIKEKA